MTKVKKRNCWEVKSCGREVGGSKVKELGTCSAATERRLDGVHGGQFAGRACWVMAGTLCGGAVQGTFAKKFETCEQCVFYNMVRQDEGLRFKMSTALLAQIRDSVIA